MDSLIKRATEDVLNTAVAVSAKMTQGQVNYVYKIEAEGHKFIVKAFKRGWPEEGKLSWIERQLTQYEVPHAKMLYFSRGDALFPHGFTISEYVEGQNALEAIAGAWIADFTQLTYWHRYSNPFSATVNHEEGLAPDAFFRGYGAVEFNAEEMAAMENALHIIHSVDLLPFYLRENNLQAFKQTKERLLLLLEQK